MRQRVTVLVGTLVAAALAQPALAIPAFARRYQVECHFCHDGYPKLNTIGQRFRERGFRMEREDSFDVDKWLRSVPISVRLQANHTFLEGADDFSYGYLKGISAGNLGSRVSYWLDDAVLVNEKKSEDQDRLTHVKPDNLWMRVQLLEENKLYAKAGRIELDVPFTQTRTPHLFSYDVYQANTGSETEGIGNYEDGLELGGDLPQDVRWSAALVKGRSTDAMQALSDEIGGFHGNVFLRLAKRFDRNRIGIFGYIGRNKLALSREVVWDDDILRLGADASVWLDRVNLCGVYMYGRNSNSIATAEQPNGTEQPLSFNGGFLQADFHVRDEVVLNLRLNVVSQPRASSPNESTTLAGLFPGVQIFLFDHLKLSFEYGFLNEERKSLGAIQAEVAF